MIFKGRKWAKYRHGQNIFLILSVPLLTCHAILAQKPFSKYSKAKPKDSEKIIFTKSAAMVDENYERRWLYMVKEQGETAPDLVLYTSEGDAFHLYEEIAKQKNLWY